MARSVSTQLRDMLAKSAERRSYVVSIATVVLVLAVLLLGIIPAIGAALDQHVNNQEQMGLVDKLENKRATLDQLQSTVTQYQTLVDRLNSYLPEMDLREDDLVDLISGLAVKYDIDLASVTFTSLERKRSIKTIFDAHARVGGKYITVSMVGGMSALSNMLSDVEHLGRIFNIRNISYTASDRLDLTLGGGSRVYDMNFRAEVFYWGEVDEDS